MARSGIPVLPLGETSVEARGHEARRGLPQKVSRADRVRKRTPVAGENFSAPPLATSGLLREAHRGLGRGAKWQGSVGVRKPPVVSQDLSMEHLT